MNSFNFSINTEISPFNAGLFISSCKGTHPTRIIDSWEIIFVNSGVLEIFEGTEKYKLHKGDAILLSPGIRHGGLADYQKDLSFYWLHFGLLKKKTLSIPKSVSLKEPEKMLLYFRAFLNEQESYSITKERGSCLIALMLLEMNRPADNENCISAKLAESARKIIDFKFRDISTSQIAKELKCNPDYLGRVFRRRYKINITDSIQQKKIHESIRKLLDSIMNINEISDDCGFSDPAYFRRVFRKHTGTSPSAYRKRYSKIHINTE